MTPSFPPTSESRHQQIQSWLQGVAASPLLALEPAAADASARRYWRAQFGDGTRIVMDAPAEGFDCSGFTKYVFSQNGINLLRVLAGNQAQRITVVAADAVGNIAPFEIADADHFTTREVACHAFNSFRK